MNDDLSVGKIGDMVLNSGKVQQVAHVNEAQLKPAAVKGALSRDSSAAVTVTSHSSKNRQRPPTRYYFDYTFPITLLTPLCGPVIGDVVCK